MEFPRDINNRIVHFLDLETRIKLGIISKLRVPQNITETLSNALDNKITNVNVYEFCISKSTISLGKCGEYKPLYKLIREFDQKGHVIHDVVFEYKPMDIKIHTISV